MFQNYPNFSWEHRTFNPNTENQKSQPTIYNSIQPNDFRKSTRTLL